MGVIQKEIELVGSKSRKKEIALFDSGVTYSCIEKELAEELGGVMPLPEIFEFLTLEKGRKIKVESHIPLIFYLNGYRFSDEFLVIENLSERVIIGAKTLQAWRLKLDFENDDIIIDPRVTKIRLFSLNSFKDF